MKNKRFEIVWNVNHASVECKQGVHSIEETTETKDKGFLFSETKYAQNVSFDELLNLSHYSYIRSYILSEFTPLVDRIEADEIDEYLQSYYNDETIYFYEAKEFIGCMTKPTLVYYPTEELLYSGMIEILKKLDFTEKVIERKGLMK